MGEGNDRRNESLIYNISLIHPNDPSQDAMYNSQWKNPLVSLDVAARATVGPNDVIIGDPTNFEFDAKTGAGSHFDWGWDLECGGADYFSRRG